MSEEPEKTKKPSIMDNWENPADPTRHAEWKKLRDELPKATPNARERAKEALLNGMIGVAIDPLKKYPFNNTGIARDEAPAELKQDFGQLNHYYTAKELFINKEAFNAYYAMSRYDRQNISDKNLKKYFRHEVLEEIISPPRNLIESRKPKPHRAVLLDIICNEITLSPFDEAAQEATKHIAQTIADNVHPRRVRHAERTGHFFIAADAKNSAVFDKNQSLKGQDKTKYAGSYSAMRKEIASTVKNLGKDIERVLSHEAGHMSDFVQRDDKVDSLNKCESLFLQLAKTKSRQHYIKMIKRDLKHLEPFMLELYQHASQRTKAPYSPELSEVISGLVNRGKYEDASTTLNILAQISRDLKKGLPPAKRYLLDLRNNKEFYDSNVLEATDALASKALKSVKDSYLTYDEQIVEIPAVVAQVCDQYGMKFARLVMPELYREVMDVQALNPNLRDDPKKFGKGVEAQGGAEKLLAGREAHRERRKEVQAAWLERLAGEQGVNASKSK